MSEAKHTPENWEVTESNSCNGYTVWARSSDRKKSTDVVASLFLPYSASAEERRQCVKARSKMIAAAPDLLSSAKDLIALIEHPSVEHDEACPQIVAMKAAIAKAEGQS